MEDNLYPRWSREMLQFMPINSLMILYKNVYDNFLFPVQKEEIKWNYCNLDKYLHLLLISSGYQAAIPDNNIKII